VAIAIIQISITKISCNISNTDIKWTTTVVYSLPAILYRLHPNHSISGCNRHRTDWTIVIVISITTNNMKQVRGIPFILYTYIYYYYHEYSSFYPYSSEWEVYVRRTYIYIYYVYNCTVRISVCLNLIIIIHRLRVWTTLHIKGRPATALILSSTTSSRYFITMIIII